MSEVSQQELPTTEQVDFFGVLNQVYQRMSRKRGSPYVWIHELQEELHKVQGYQKETFYRLLRSLPLVVMGKQMLFSPAAFSKPGGVMRNGRYYNLITIYPNFWSPSEEIEKP